MQNEFVIYQFALRMKALGFDNVPCLAIYYGVPKLEDWEYEFFDFHNHFTTNSHYETQYYAQKGYENGILTPTWKTAFDWFRENYGYWCYIKEATKGTSRFYIEKFDEKFFNSEIIDSYEQAQKKCLEKLIEIVEELKNK